MSTHKLKPVPLVIKDSTWGALHEGQCSHCRDALKKGESYCYDPVCDADYCAQCGQTLRYHRKKAVERGETAPATHSEADTRFRTALKKA